MKCNYIKVGVAASDSVMSRHGRPRYTVAEVIGKIFDEDGSGGNENTEDNVENNESIADDTEYEGIHDLDMPGPDLRNSHVACTNRSSVSAKQFDSDALMKIFHQQGLDDVINDVLGVVIFDLNI